MIVKGARHAQGYTYILVDDEVPNGTLQVQRKHFRLARIIVKANAVQLYSAPHRQYDHSRIIPTVKMLRDYFNLGLAEAKAAYDCAASDLLNSGELVLPPESPKPEWMR
jgi:hypothetical protein